MSFAEGNLTSSYEGACIKWLKGKGEGLWKFHGIAYGMLDYSYGH